MSVLKKKLRRLSYSSSQLKSMRISSRIASQMARFPRGSSHDWVRHVDKRPGRPPKQNSTQSQLTRLADLSPAVPPN